MESKTIGYLVGAVITVFILLLISPFTVVGAGERGVVLSWGAVQDRVLGEGIHFVMPIRDDVETLDVKTRKEEVQVNAASKDLQSVSAKIALNYHLEPTKVNKLWQQVGEDYAERVIAPAIQESVKAATAKYTAEELVTKRNEVKDEMKLSLVERISKNDIIVDDVSIVDFEFSAGFNAAIEAKVTAEQSALAAKNKLEQVKFEAQQSIEKAKAEAESIKLQSEAANNEKYVSLKALEVQLEFARRWDGKLPVQMVPGGAVPFLNLK